MQKFPPQWMMSKGIPCTHQLRAKAQPPLSRYTGVHSAPKASPKPPDSAAQPRGDSIRRSSQAAPARMSHTYT